MPPDPRRVVGGFAWAKALHVSKDARRIYGVDVDRKWLRGTVLEVITSRPEGSRRATTMVKARFQVGNTEKVKCINLAQTKKDDPNATAPSSPPPLAGTAQAENQGETSTGVSDDNEAPDLATPARTIPAGTVPPTAGTTATGVSTTSNSTGSSSRVPKFTCKDGSEWYEGDTELPTNGPFVKKTWKLTDQYSGTEYTPGCDPNKTISPLDFFMAVFPKEQLSYMMEKTNEGLVVNGHSRLTKGELLKFFGILILITRFEFGQRASLWATTSRCKYIPAPNLGEKTGMTRDRFTSILRYLVWSEQPCIRPDGMSSEEYRWKLVDGFVDRINKHRANFMHPSWLVCVDESISRWYGLGGHWINIGLPMYVAIDRKPEDGLEIQDSCCAKSGILLQLKLVKTAEANAADE
jgi:Transposase IS4